MARVAVILIGNELLSGKIEDQNARYAVRLLRERGADLERIAVIPDAIGEIAAEVRRCVADYDWVITSGGVGPTHDDMTYEGVAAGLEVPLVEHAEVAAMLRTYFGTRLTDDHLRMARFPEGALVHTGLNLPIPVVTVGRVAVLPGIPSLFRMALDFLAPMFQGLPFFLEEVVCHHDEGEIAAFLRDVQQRFADVSIGSYPGRTADGVEMVRITVEGRSERSVAAAAAEIRGRLLA